MKQQAEAGEKEEATPSISSLSEHFRLRNEAAASLNKTEEATESKPATAQSVAKPADGKDFIIVEDVPVVDFNDYSFGESEPFSRPAPAYAPVEPQHSAPKFHRFKDDVLIQQQLQARAEGKTFATPACSRTERPHYRCQRCAGSRSPRHWFPPFVGL